MVEERHLPILLYVVLILVVLFPQGSQGISERSYVYINALYGFEISKVSIILDNLLRETKRFISSKEEGKIGVG